MPVLWGVAEKGTSVRQVPSLSDASYSSSARCHCVYFSVRSTERAEIN